jgi:hypothetical protein
MNVILQVHFFFFFTRTPSRHWGIGKDPTRFVSQLSLGIGGMDLQDVLLGRVARSAIRGRLA